MNVPKACFRSTAKKMPKSIGARMQPCFTPLRMSKASEVDLLKTTVPFMFLWKDLMIWRSFGGHTLLGRILKRLSLLTRLNALVRSINAINNDCFCSLHFTCNCLSENMMSVVDLPAQKPHCDSERTCSASTWSCFSTTWANNFPAMLRIFSVIVSHCSHLCSCTA